MAPHQQQGWSDGPLQGWCGPQQVWSNGWQQSGPPPLGGMQGVGHPGQQYVPVTNVVAYMENQRADRERERADRERGRAEQASKAEFLEAYSFNNGRFG